MQTMRELVVRLSEVARSYLSDAAMLAALRGMLNLHVDEEHPYCDDSGFKLEDIDDEFKRGRLQGAAALETVAAQRDALATKLHALGNVANPLTAQQRLAAEKAEAALGWIAKRPPQQAERVKRLAWKEAELLPVKPCWCVVRSRDGKQKTDAYWDGLDFVLAHKRRLVAGERWSEIALKRRNLKGK